MTTRPLLGARCLAMLALALPCWAAPASDTLVAIPDDATLEARGTRIRDVTILVGDIFDPTLPGEDRWLYRLANRLHRRTRNRVIRRLLLFRSGDLYARAVLDESERLLRSTRYLYDAKIRPVRYEEDVVDVEVVVRDVWTLQGGISVSRSGGENTTRIGLQDVNFLGTGKDLTVRRTDSIDRTSVLYRYRDPNVLGSRVRLTTRYDDNTDGKFRAFDVQRPFYSLDTRWSAIFLVNRSNRIDSLYSLGEIVEQFAHDETRFEGYAAFSRGIVGGSVRRWGAGFGFEKDRFRRSAGSTPALDLPRDRTLAFPFVGFEWIDDAFVETRDVDNIQRTEDLNLGHQLFARLGWASKNFGGDVDRAVFSAAYRYGSRIRTKNLVLVAGETSGRWHAGSVEDFVIGAGVRYFHRQSEVRVFFLGARADVSSALDGEDQLLLGGDSGLRGYPIRYAAGDRRFLVTAEQRWYFDWQPLRLAYVGAAVFADVGRCWFERGAEPEGLGVLKDVGAGLRISPSRAGLTNVLHVDVAFPLDRQDSIESVQFLVTGKRTF